MRLKATQNGQAVSESQFIKGPIYIGRHPQSQVFLSHHSVSRQHAVIFLDDNGRWAVRDLKSANHTYVNSKVITEVPLKTGDKIQVGVFIFQIDLERGQPLSPSIQLDDTHAPMNAEPQVIVRQLNNRSAPAIRVPAHRAGDLRALLCTAARGGNSGETVSQVLDVLLKQFDAHRVWCSFRYDPEGITEEEGGRTEMGELFILQQERIKTLLDQACRKGQYILLTHLKQPTKPGKEQSAILAPILGGDKVYGEIYLDSKPGKTCFSMSDLDYAMLLAVSLSVVLENF
ncbi:MAG: FHA domain-containing protein [Phycisphaeraceae bacterium]|nr:FHA domain-containing protein [Phycisphaeraceae bacterium]